MDEHDFVETLELDEDHFVSVESSRQWPKYVVTWAVRRRAGAESDFPLHTGTLERMPPKDPNDLDRMLEEMRQEAIDQARVAAAAATEANPPQEKRSLWERLFGKR